MVPIAVTWWPSPVLYTFRQSHPSVPLQIVFHPALSSQTYCPPATQWVGSWTSFSIGAMKRGLGSHGSGGSVAVRHDGEISVSSSTDASRVLNMSRNTYSTTAQSPLAGATIVSPPSPVKACSTLRMSV